MSTHANRPSDSLPISEKIRNIERAIVSNSGLTVEQWQTHFKIRFNEVIQLHCRQGRRLDVGAIERDLGIY